MTKKTDVKETDFEKQYEAGKNIMHSIPLNFFSLFVNAWNEGYIENVTHGNFEASKRFYNARFNQWIKKKYNLSSDEDLKIEDTSVHQYNPSTNLVGIKNPNPSDKCKYYTLNNFIIFLKEYYKDSKEIKDLLDKQKRKNKIEVGLISDESKRVISLSLKSKMNTQQIEKLCNELNSQGFIVAALPIFKSIFADAIQPLPNPIKWYKTNPLLAYLFKKLHENNLIENSYWQSVLEKGKCFVNSNNTPIKASNLASAKSGIKHMGYGSPNDIGKINEILKSIKKLSEHSEV